MLNKISEYYRNPRVREWLILFLVAGINLAIKTIPAAILELGNDEVYYWTYALFPDWSHFDHPPMVGLTIQLFTLNLTFTNELMMRMGSLIFSTLNLFILYHLVKKLYSQRAATISILLYTSSFYFNIISGLFILPDSPQMLFVMLALYFGVPAIVNKQPSKKDEFNIVLFGLFTGIAFLSKYHSLFLWLGFGLYIILNNRQWFKKPALYLSVFITLLMMTPVIYWNFKNNFISFAFHESRVGVFQSHFNLHSFIEFFLGQFFYQNPVLFILFFLSLVMLLRPGKKLNDCNLLLIFLALPMILVFTLISFFRTTLPHWTGPAFISLLILTSKYLSDIFEMHRKAVFNSILSGNLLFFFILIAGTIQTRFGLILPEKVITDPTSLGRYDFSLDMYGWDQAYKKFHEFLSKEQITATDKVKIISNRWFPAAHLDYYVAYPMKIDLIVPAKLESAHKYFWIDMKRHLLPGDKIYYITTSQQFFSPEIFKSVFPEIIPRDTLHIMRNGHTVKNLFIYEMKGLRTDSKDFIPSMSHQIK